MRILFNLLVIFALIFVAFGRQVSFESTTPVYESFKRSTGEPFKRWLGDMISSVANFYAGRG
jgi:hypothetical protein